MKTRGMLCLAVAGLCTAIAVAPARAQGPFHVQQEWKVGGDGGWDYLAVDPHSKLLYITRGDHVMVIDTASGKQVADIPGLHGIHCVVFSSDGVHGYITDGGANQVVEFNRRTNTVEKTIPAGDHPDGAVFEPVTKTVWAFNGRSHNVTVIDTKTDRVVATIALPGKPEFPVADGRGYVFDNIEDKSELVKLNARTLKLDATWPLAPCESPSGLAIDAVHRRLFPVCDNQVMAVVDANNGKVVTTVAIGDGPDAARFAASGQYAFSPNGGSGTLTVIHEDSPDHYSVVQTLSTKRGARTMAMDPDGARVYVVTAEFGPRPETATTENPHRRPPILPGSFEIIAVGR
ncbi:MAG: YncE family protein [Acidobacteriaceae bacterium]